MPARIIDFGKMMSCCKSCNSKSFLESKIFFQKRLELVERVVGSESGVLRKMRVSIELHGSALSCLHELLILGRL